ncbi:MAG: hypothetical protein HY774_29140 [Acidobacteria bacterium]|nr:hypothetical protein [Acidobacteriota bacterium]
MVFHLVVIGILFFVVYGVMALFGQGVWWVALTIATVVYLAGRLMIKNALKNLFLAPFKAKGAVLRGAQAQVHSIMKVDAPVKEAGLVSDEAEEISETRPDRSTWKYYEIDVTISPQSQNGAFSHWEPGELRLLPIHAEVSPDNDDDEEISELSKLEIFEEGIFKPDEGYKFPGSQRLRLLTAVHPAHQQVKFAYYFETFGNLTLPN